MSNVSYRPSCTMEESTSISFLIDRIKYTAPIHPITPPRFPSVAVHAGAPFSTAQLPAELGEIY